MSEKITYSNSCGPCVNELNKFGGLEKEYGFTKLIIIDDYFIKIYYNDINNNNFINKDILLLTYKFECNIPRKYLEIIGIMFQRGYNTIYYGSMADLSKFIREARTHFIRIENEIKNNSQD